MMNGKKRPLLDEEEILRIRSQWLAFKEEERNQGLRLSKLCSKWWDETYPNIIFKNKKETEGEGTRRK